MTPERLAELERLASEACDGEDPSEFGHWEVRRNFLFRLPCDDGSHVELDGVTVEPEWSEGDVSIWCELPIHANFIAAANPATILDIIAHIRDLETQVREARAFIRNELSDRHFSIKWRELKCGSPIGTSIDTCERCEPWRTALSKLATATPPSPEVGE